MEEFKTFDDARAFFRDLEPASIVSTNVSGYPVTYFRRANCFKHADLCIGVPDPISPCVTARFYF